MLTLQRSVSSMTGAEHVRGDDTKRVDVLCQVRDLVTTRANGRDWELNLCQGSPSRRGPNRPPASSVRRKCSTALSDASYLKAVFRVLPILAFRPGDFLRRCTIELGDISTALALSARWALIISAERYPSHSFEC